MTTNAKARILVLDDDIGTQSTYRRILELHGYRVVTAGGGGGLVLLRSENEEFDLVLSDLRMPDVSGLEVLAELHRNRPHVPVVMITAFGTAAAEAASRLLGAVDFVDRLPDVDGLVEIVRRALDKSTHLPRVSRARTVLSPGPAIRRWVRMVVTVAQSDHDLPTLLDWAEQIGKSVTTIKRWCLNCGLHASESLDFARALRIVVLHAGSTCDWYNELDIAEHVTMTAFLQRAAFVTHGIVPDLPTFLDHQQFVVSSVLLNTVLVTTLTDTVH